MGVPWVCFAFGGCSSQPERTGGTVQFRLTERASFNPEEVRGKVSRDTSFAQVAGTSLSEADIKDEYPTYVCDIVGAAAALEGLGGLVVVLPASDRTLAKESASHCGRYPRPLDNELIENDLGWAAPEALVLREPMAPAKLASKVADKVVERDARFVAVVSVCVGDSDPHEPPAELVTIRDAVRVPTFCIVTNGLHDYVRGAGHAIEALVQLLIEQSLADVSTASRAGAAASSTGGSRCVVGLLGFTNLDFPSFDPVRFIGHWVMDQGYSVCDWHSMCADVLVGKKSPSVPDVNLVVTTAGLRAAWLMERELGVPFVTGLPVSGFQDTLANSLQATLADGESRRASLFGRRSTMSKKATEVAGNAAGDKVLPAAGSPHDQVVVVGGGVIAGSIASALDASGMQVQVVCPLEDANALLLPTDVVTRGALEAGRALNGARAIIADPNYQQVVDPSVRFVSVVHPALSRKETACMPDLFRTDLASLVN